ALWVFFFSSRRRHTRSLRDWSSDVCSSGLIASTSRSRSSISFVNSSGSLGFETPATRFMKAVDVALAARYSRRRVPHFKKAWAKIGRASCRERVNIEGVEGAVKKKNEV